MTLTKPSFVQFAGCATWLGLVAAQAAPTAMPGQWEFTTKSTMQAPMNMAMPATTSKFCIKPEDVKDLSKQTMAGAGRGPMPENCKMLDQKVAGDTVSYKMHCDGKAPIDVAGEINYQGSSYQGKSQMEMKGPEGLMKVSTEFSGKRIGDCK